MCRRMPWCAELASSGDEFKLGESHLVVRGDRVQAGVEQLLGLALLS